MAPTGSSYLAETDLSHWARTWLHAEIARLHRPAEGGDGVTVCMRDGGLQLQSSEVHASVLTRTLTLTLTLTLPLTLILTLTVTVPVPVTPTPTLARSTPPSSRSEAGVRSSTT